MPNELSALPVKVMDAAECGWVAGFSESEGRVYLMAGRYPRVIANWTDLDVLMKVQVLTRIGVVRTRARTGLGRKPRWLWTVSRTRESIELVHPIRPFTCDRRGPAIDRMLSAVWAFGAYR